MALFWIHKTAKSTSLSHSDGSERLQLLSQAQRTTRPRRKTLRQFGRTHKLRRQPRKVSAPSDEFSDAFCTYTLEYPPSLHPDWTDEVRRGLCYFREVTMYKILTVDRDGAFWKGIVPGVAERYAAFRHLVVAIATTHELIFHEQASDLNRLALEQCNKATSILRSSNELGVPLLLVSCILVTAYHLLRCDAASADRCIESGLGLVTRSGENPFTTYCRPQEQLLVKNLMCILTRLGKSHGFKLWAPDIAYSFERSSINKEALVVDMSIHARGPFVDSAQMLVAYKTLLHQLLGKVLRNLAGGAFIDPECLFAKEASRQLGMFSYYWDAFYNTLTPDKMALRLEVIQLRLGFYNIYSLLHTKILGSSDMGFDSMTWVYQKMIDLASEIIAARVAGHLTAYAEIVNGALFSLGMCCRDPSIRRRAITLLRDQSSYEDGLVNWLRSLIVEMVMDVEESGIDVKQSSDVPLSRRVHLQMMSCRQPDKAVCLTYAAATALDRGVNLKASWHTWDFDYGADLSAREIDDCLQGMMATYTGYGKADRSRAMSGVVRPLIFEGRPVPVYWDKIRA